MWGRGSTRWPIRALDKVQEFRQQVYSFSFAPCREHVLSELTSVVVRPLVGFKVRLDVSPRGLSGIGVIPLFIKERNGVINDSVRITQSFEIPVRSPAITDHRSARFDSSIYNGHQSVAGSVRYWNK